MDILNIMSFAIGLQNLDKNLDQTKADQMLKSYVEDIHKHLEEQDKRLERIEVMLNETNKKDDW